MREFVFLFPVVCLLGCDAPVESPAVEPPAAVEPTVFDGPTGRIIGQVRWSGAIPAIPALRTFRPAPGGKAELVSRNAPNVPIVDATSLGVNGALVYLRDVRASARKWDHAPVTIELNDERPMVRQGDGKPGRIGLVRRGDSVSIVSKQELFHALRARGSTFWTFTLPDMDRPIARRLDRAGIVELSSAAGYYWMHGYLYVSEHPYCAVTDDAGRFELPRVPPGEYELVTWLPSWDIVRRERDPESMALTRIFFGPARESIRKVLVEASQTAEVSVTIPE